MKGLADSHRPILTECTPWHGKKENKSLVILQVATFSWFSCLQCWRYSLISQLRTTSSRTYIFCIVKATEMFKPDGLRMHLLSLSHYLDFLSHNHDLLWAFCLNQNSFLSLSFLFTAGTGLPLIALFSLRHISDLHGLHLPSCCAVLNILLSFLRFMFQNVMNEYNNSDRYVYIIWQLLAGKRQLKNTE